MNNYSYLNAQGDPTSYTLTQLTSSSGRAGALINAVVRWLLDEGSKGLGRLSLTPCFNWCARQDLNLRPAGSKPDALSN